MVAYDEVKIYIGFYGLIGHRYLGSIKNDSTKNEIKIKVCYNRVKYLLSCRFHTPLYHLCDCKKFTSNNTLYESYKISMNRYIALYVQFIKIH